MKKQIVAKVLSDKMQKTRVVISEVFRKHPLYKKYYRHLTKYYVHDEKEVSRTGDLVMIEETRPLSKLKRWRLLKVIKKAEGK